MKILIILTVIFCGVFVEAMEVRQFPNPGQIYIPGKDTGFAQYLTKSLRGTQKVALTFDDGPDIKNTPKLLDTLKKYNVKATFFVLTEKINLDTLPIVYRIMAEGHNLGSHHFNHISADNKSEAVYREELQKSIINVSSLMAEQQSVNTEVYYRFPYGAYGSKKLGYHHMNVMKEVSQKLFGDNCINFAFWDIDTVDWLEAMTPDDITQNVMAHLFGGTGFDFVKNSNGTYSKKKITITKPVGGGVVLMHDVHTRSVDAVPKLLQKFVESGVEVVPLQDVEEYAFNGKVCRLN